MNVTVDFEAMRDVLLLALLTEDRTEQEQAALDTVEGGVASSGPPHSSPGALASSRRTYRSGRGGGVMIVQRPHVSVRSHRFDGRLSIVTQCSCGWSDWCRTFRTASRRQAAHLESAHPELFDLANDLAPNAQGEGPVA